MKREIRYNDAVDVRFTPFSTLKPLKKPSGDAGLSSLALAARPPPTPAGPRPRSAHAPRGTRRGARGRAAAGRDTSHEVEGGSAGSTCRRTARDNSRQDCAAPCGPSGLASGPGCTARPRWRLSHPRLADAEAADGFAHHSLTGCHLLLPRFMVLLRRLALHLRCSLVVKGPQPFQYDFDKPRGQAVVRRGTARRLQLRRGHPHRH